MSIILCDVDGTLLNGDTPNAALIDALNRSGEEVIVVSARPDSRTEETRNALRDAGLRFSEIHLSDFPQGPNAGVAFKKAKAESLIADGKDVEKAIDNDEAARAAYESVGLETYTPAEFIADEGRAIDPNGYEPTEEMRAEAERGLKWRREFGRGGTLVGVARARDISNGVRLPIETVRRMASYFARHEVDKQGAGYNAGEDGYPSAGRIAWALWGGDPAQSWASRIIAEAERSASTQGDEMSIEFRQGIAELRAVGEDGMTFEGFAAVYDSPSAEGTNPEVIKPGAFSRSLAAAQRGEWDVKAYQDHNPQMLLGTTKSGTLELQDTEQGLLARIRLNPEISFHRDLAAIVRSMGRSLGMSFGFFSTAANKINDAGVRELRDVKLVEVSALTGLAPYYPGTISTVAVRSLADRAGVQATDLRDALTALLAGEINPEKATVLATAIRSVAPELRERLVAGADRTLDIDEETPWDGAAAAARVFAWAGFDGENPDPAAARRAFLIHDADAPTLRGGYKLGFADIIDGRLVALRSGLNAAASRLPQTDAPQDVLDAARATIDAYQAEEESNAVPRSVREKQIELAKRALR